MFHVLAMHWLLILLRINLLWQGVAQRLGKYVKGIEDPDQIFLRTDKLGVKVGKRSTPADSTFPTAELLVCGCLLL